MSRRLVGHRLDGIDAFAFEDAALPVPGAGEVRVAVEAVGLGFLDTLLVAGRYQWVPPVPYVPGGEIVGTVEACGPGAETWTPGARVACWRMDRGAADHAILPADSLVAVPPGLAPADAAALILDYATARYALTVRDKLRAGEAVLVLGAAGGVGGAAVHLAARAGAFVVAGAASPERRASAVARGAHAVVDYMQPDWRQSLAVALDSRPLALVVDPLGGDVSEAAFRSLGKGGRHLVLGFAAGTIPRLPLNLPLLKSASLVGVDVRHLAETEPAAFRVLLASLFEDAVQGRLTPPPILRFPLAHAHEALSAVAARDRIGKVVLIGAVQPSTLR